MLTKTLICYPDSVLITLLIAALGIPLLYAVFRADGYIESAEHHVDGKHWAGVPHGYGFVSFVYRYIRIYTGMGYKPTGRRNWWAGSKWVLLTAALLFVSVAYLFLRARTCKFGIFRTAGHYQLPICPAANFAQSPIRMLVCPPNR